MLVLTFFSVPLGTTPSGGRGMPGMHGVLKNNAIVLFCNINSDEYFMHSKKDKYVHGMR